MLAKKAPDRAGPLSAFRPLAGAGERRTVALDLPHGVYRLRTLEAGDEETVDWDEAGFPEVIADGDSVSAGPPAAPGEIALANTAQRELTFIVEERAWMRDALTADRVTALQVFRDLFTADVLRPGDDVEIDYITMMFTDLNPYSPSEPDTPCHMSMILL